MIDIFENISSIYGVKDESFCPIRDSRLVLDIPIENVHKAIAVMAHDKAHSNILIFENDMYVTDNKSFLGNEELYRFLKESSMWDILLVELPTHKAVKYEDYEDFLHIHKITDTSFVHSSIYVMSRRFLKKAKTGDMNDIHTFYVDNMYVKSTSLQNKKDAKYLVGHVGQIEVSQKGQFKYKWTNIMLA